jgi:hypothetical protein
MDAADLRMFQSVAGTGSMSKAALKLNTVQSNVTARIKSFEDEVGFARRIPDARPARWLLPRHSLPGHRGSWRPRLANANRFLAHAARA